VSGGTDVTVRGQRPSGPQAMPSPGPPDLSSLLDAESQAWLEGLNSDGQVREEAIAKLHAVLLRAARFEALRRRAMTPGVSAAELDDLALQSADDALVAILTKLDRFRGQSRFTTWAYKFALLEASVKLRRRPWQGRELPLETDGWPHVADAARSPHTLAEQRDLLDAVGNAIAAELTPHQREILVAVALNGVPIDVLAERLGTTRGALYKTIHDARRKLRRKLTADGYSLEPAGEDEQR